MKKIILATLAAASLVACAQEDVVYNTDNNAIKFDNAFVGNTTKAIDPSITNPSDTVSLDTDLTKFLVYGTTKGVHANAEVINIFNAEEVAINANGDGWNYAADKTQYWLEGNKYNFAAVVNVGLDKTKITTDTNGMPTSVVYAANNGDLLYARSAEDIEGLASGNKPVAFTFDHLLSKVKFSFKNETPTSTDTEKYTYRVTNIEMTGTYAEATCALDNYTWTKNNDNVATTNYGHIVAEGVNENEEAVKVGPEATYYSNYENLVIPGTYNVNIKCQIELLIGEQVAKVIAYDNNVKNLTLSPGTAYNFVLTGELGDSIEFIVTKVNEWHTPASV